jgi:hypothetical protein
MGTGAPVSAVFTNQLSTASLSPGHLYLRHENDVLPLFPLLLYERCGCGTPPDVCELTKTFFFNGGDRRPEYVDYLMGHVKQVPAAAEAVQEIIARSKERLSLELQEVPEAVSAELMRDSVRGFGGRTDEEEDILRYVASHERGRVAPATRAVWLSCYNRY